MKRTSYFAFLAAGFFAFVAVFFAAGFVVFFTAFFFAAGIVFPPFRWDAVG
jgi:hypothetical protein